MSCLIKHFQIGLIAALSFARVGDFNHQIDVRSVMIPAFIRHWVTGVIDPCQGGSVQLHGPQCDKGAGLIGFGASQFFELNGFAMVSRRVGIGDIF